MDILRQNVGIDVAKDSFVATLTVLLKGQIVDHIRTRTFDNSVKGFTELLRWVNKLKHQDIPVHFTMEATGVYYESLAYYLWDRESIIHVLLPNKAKKFGESLNIKSKTDKIDSRILGQMGVERALSRWTLSSKIYRKLKTLTRERQQLIKERTRCKNQLHAETESAEPLRTTLSRCRNLIKYLNKQIVSIENEIKTTVKKDDFVHEKIEKITTTPGISLITAVVVIAETNGFQNFSSIKQLTSFVGYDVQIKESGKWKGKAKISKKGNSHIRHALFMPSLSVLTHSNTYNVFYNRLNEKKQNGLIANTAVQRKILGLMYTLWKNDTEYIENYQQNKVI